MCYRRAERVGYAVRALPDKLPPSSWEPRSARTAGMVRSHLPDGANQPLPPGSPTRKVPIGAA